jgi:peroxiredoxin
MEKYDGIHRTTFVIDENGIIDEVIEKTKAHADKYSSKYFIYLVVVVK